MKNVQILNSKDHIQRFIDLLSEADKKDYTSIIKNFDFGLIDFSPYENWTTKHYTRNCFYRDDRFELLLICWEKGHQTSIHDHNGEDCWVYVLQGKMEEEFYTLKNDGGLKLRSVNSLNPKMLTKSGNGNGFHRLKNDSGQRSLSLHVYAKPIEQSRFYDENLGKLVEKNLSYDTYKPLESEIKIN